METATNLNKMNKTDKFILFPYPTVNVDFLTKNFYKKIDDKEKRVITYRPSSGPTRENTSRAAKTMEGAKRFRTGLFRKYPRFRRFYMKIMHGMARKIEETTSSDRLITVNKTAEYLAEFQKSHPDVKGFMTRGRNAPEPFESVDIKEADKYYDYIGASYVVILASATYASITFYAACVGTPSVGSKDTTMQRLLFPELAFDENDVDSIVSAMKRLFEDRDFYAKQQSQGLENANRYFSDKALEKRFYDCVGEFQNA
jgi:glycosyltransferase involved in cell wall biosynthesis